MPVTLLRFLQCKSHVCSLYCAIVEGAEAGAVDLHMTEMAPSSTCSLTMNSPLLPSLHSKLLQEPYNAIRVSDRGLSIIN